MPTARQVALYGGGARLPLNVSDTFTRADNALTLGNAESGHPWVVPVGTGGISSNKAYFPSGTDGDRAVINAGYADVVVTAKCKGAATDLRAAVVVRWGSIGNELIAMVLSDNTIKLYRGVAGVYTQIGTAASGITYTVEHTIKVSAVGSAINVYVNDVLKITVTETAGQTNTYHGIAPSVSGSGRTWDDFTVVPG